MVILKAVAGRCGLVPEVAGDVEKVMRESSVIVVRDYVLPIMGAILLCLVPLTL